MSLNGSFDAHNGTTTLENDSGPYFQPFGVRYRIVATVAYSVIFLLGITGNSIVIFTIYGSSSLHTSAYAYLASLACADLMVICTAIPEGLVYTISSGLWYSESSVCAIFVFMNFFCINVGTLSMMAFTLERYIATCRPFLAQKLCTVERSRKIIGCCWILAFVYCSPWLGLAEVAEDPNEPEIRQCQLNLSQGLHTALFTTDLIIFYIVPLVGAMFVYWNIGRVLRDIPNDPGGLHVMHRGLEMEHSVRRHSHSSTWKRGSTTELPLSRNEAHVARNYGSILSANASRGNVVIVLERNGRGRASRQLQRDLGLRGKPITRRSAAQSLRILVATVLLFAIGWLPFRGLLIYNSIVDEPWLNLWYALFSKCMIFLNCCVNPFLYTLLSKRFRGCVQKALTFKKLTGSASSSFTRN